MSSGGSASGAGAASTGAARSWITAYLLALAAWMAWRAAHLSITCDEATTLLDHVPAGWGSIFAHSGPIASNNHLLNTLGIKTLLFVLPEREWVVRLPALLGFVLYASAARRWVLAGSSGLRALTGIVLLTANPFVLDMLVLARGYGLGLGLWVWSAVLALEWSTLGQRGWIRPAASAVLSGLALCANLSFVFPVVALGLLAAGGVLVEVGRGEGTARWRAAGIAALAWGATAGAIAGIYRPEVLARIQNALLNWGGLHGVWADSIPSLVAASLWRGADPGWVQGGTLALAGVLGLGSLWALRDLVCLRAPGRLGLSCGLAWLVIGGMSLRQQVTGARVSLDRGVLVLLPILLAIVLATWERAGARGGSGARALAVAAGLFLAVDAGAYRFGWTHIWSFDAPAREAMGTIAELTRGRAEGSVRLAVWRPVWKAMEYYRLRQGVTAVAPTQPFPPWSDITARRPRTRFDLYYYRAEDAARVAGLELALERSFPIGNTFLARPAGRPR